MPSTYTTNTGIEKIGDGEQSGLWGQTTNLNFDIVDRALNGVGTITLSGTTHTLSTTAGVLSDGQFSVLVFAGTPSGPNTVTIAPDTAQKRYWVRNTTAENVILAQGSGATVTVPPGTSKAVYTNGAGATAAVFDLTNTLAGNLTGNVTGDLTGNAGTATALQTARTIGGVSFDGTANINLPGVNQTGNQNTTGSAATLTTARTLTIGSTGKTFNGSADVAWNLSEIGAQASSAQLTSLAALATNGIIARTATNTVTARTITGTADQITVTDGDGVSGNPTIAAVVASKAEAEAGTDNTKLMTALRTKEAIAPVVQGTSGAPKIDGLALGRLYLGVLNAVTSTPAGFNDLPGFSRLLFLGARGPAGTSGGDPPRIRFSTDNGSTWGSYIDFANNEYLTPFNSVLQKSTNQVFHIYGPAPLSETRSVTVPSTANAFQIRGGGGTYQAHVFLIGGDA